MLILIVFISIIGRHFFLYSFHQLFDFLITLNNVFVFVLLCSEYWNLIQYLCFVKY